MANLSNEVPTCVYSVRFVQSVKLGPGYWVIQERQILESANSWVLIGDKEPPGYIKLDQMELDLDGMTVANEQIFYATRERAERFLNRWKDPIL